uniref:extracellular solute-binding protein n=1 Tax=Streptomyces scabiei TaxID=1930 RepID=UPI0038F7F14E
AQNEDLTIKLIFPKEGGIGWVDNFAIASGAKNVDAAHKMIDFLLRPEIAEQISRDTGYLTGVAESNAKFKDIAPLFPSQEDLDRVEWQDAVGDKTIKYENYFMRLKSGL